MILILAILPFFISCISTDFSHNFFRILSQSYVALLCLGSALNLGMQAAEPQRERQHYSRGMRGMQTCKQPSCFYFGSHKEPQNSSKFTFGTDNMSGGSICSQI